MKKFSRYLLLSFVSLAIVFISLVIFAKPAQARCGDDDQADFQSSGAIDCGDEIWHYDPVRSIRFGRPIFVDSKGDYLRIVDGDTAEIVDIDSNNVTDEVGLDDYQNYDRDANSNYCSMNRPINCKVWDGADFDDYRGPPDPGEIFNNSNASPQDVATLRAEIRRIFELLSEAEAAADALESCEDGLNNPLSFILCPINNFITSTLTTIVETLASLLENPKLTGSTSLKTALGSMVTLANSFYILIFLFIIIANFVTIPGLDNYTIKKTLPKLIAAIILTQFSLLICQTILDLGNILAVTLPSQILDAFNIAGTPAEAFVRTIVPQISNISNFGDLFEELGKFAIFQLTMLVGIIVAIIAFFYLLARYLFLIGLVLACPLAFAAWVLPNTEQFFKKWWAYFIKLSIMFLLVNLLFVMGAVFVELIADGNVFSGGGATGVFQDFFTSLISIIIPIIVLLLIPKTLKVSGAIMAKSQEAIGKAYNNAKDTRAGKAVSKSAQEGKLAEVKGGAYEKFGKSNVLGAKRSARLEAKGAGLQAKAGEQIKSDVGNLGLDRQLDLAKNSKNTDVKKAAQRALDTKRRELANTRSIDASQLGQQLLLKHDGDRVAAERELKTHLQRVGVAGASNAQLGEDGKVTGDGLDLRATFQNPEFPDYKSGGGGTGSTPLSTSGPASSVTLPTPTGGSPSGGTGSTPSTPLPPPTPTGGSRSSGGTSPGGLPSGTPSRRTGARSTPTPTPPPTSPSTPSSLPTPEPPEPPPTTE